MSKLKVYKFSELYKMSSGISTKPEQAGHGKPFLSFRTVFNNYYIPEDLHDFMDVTEKESIEYSIKNGDVFLTRTSETLDELGMSCVALKDYEQATFSGFLKRLRPTQDNITYDRYMVFYLRSKFFRKVMTVNSIMTLRASFNEQIFSYLKLFLPSYAIQKRIGDLLFNISEKINFNNKINAELEAMAKTLYNYWFVQFDFPDENGKPYKSSGAKMVYNAELKRAIPEGWEVKSLGEINSILVRGISPKYVEERGIQVINQRCIRDNSIDFKFCRLHDNNSKSVLKIVEIGDVLVNSTGVGTLGRVAIVKRLEHPQTTADSHVTIIRIRPNAANPCYAAFTLLNKQQDIEQLGEGSTGQTELSRENLAKLKILLPCNGIQTSFEKIIKPTIKKAALNEEQNDKLSILRDWLLPMLMNGQVTVNDAYQLAEEKVSMVAEP